MLLPLFPAESTRINDLLCFEKRDGKVWYFHGCMPVFSHDVDDRATFRMYTSQLVETGQCKQVEIVRAFGVSAISVKRHVKRLREGGMAAFFPRQPARKPRVWTPEVIQQAQALLQAGTSRAEVAQTLQIKPDTLYRAIRSGQLTEPEKKGVRKAIGP
jgi:transposase-like protein